MIDGACIDRSSLLRRLDPRGRVVVALAFAVLVAVAESFAVLAHAFALGVLLVVIAGLPARRVFGRLAAVNIFTLLLWAMVPWATPGTPAWGIGPLTASREGVRLCAQVTLKANAIMLATTALLSTMSLAELGHALWHLHVPHKLTNLFLFTARYLGLLRDEQERMRVAMRARGFRPRADLRTWRTCGHLAGSLLVRALERSERVLLAM